MLSPNETMFSRQVLPACILLYGHVRSSLYFDPGVRHSPFSSSLEELTILYIFKLSFKFFAFYFER